LAAPAVEAMGAARAAEYPDHGRIDTHRQPPGGDRLLVE
jgi:hypothetical protein